MKLFLKYVTPVFLMLVVWGCEREEGFGNSNIVSDAEDNRLREVSMLLNIQVSDTSYVVADKVDSIKVRVNDSTWGYFTSSEVDTTVVNKWLDGKYYVTRQKLNFFVRGNSSAVDSSDFQTAGEYASYINSFNELSPGEYVCMVESYQLTDVNGVRHTYYPFAYQSFEVDDNQESVFVGEFSVKLDE